MITEYEFLEQISKIEENGYTIRKHIWNKLSVLLKKQQLKQMDYQIFNSSDSQMAKVVFQTYSKDQQSSQQANLKDTSSCNQNTIEDQIYQKSNNQEIVQDFKNMKFNSQLIDQGLTNVEFKNKDIIQGFDAMEVNNEEAVQFQLQSYDYNNLEDYQNNQLDHKMIIKKWDINEFNNNNKNLSQHFKKKQSEIVQKLSEFSLFLEQCILCKENEDIFEGYKSFDNKTIQSLTFIIKYYPTKQEVNQELRIIRDLEKYQQNKQFQLIQLQEQNITIFQFQQEKFSYYQNKMERAISLKKNWSKQYFDHLNENKQLNFQFCQQCQGCIQKKECQGQQFCKLFKKNQDLILDSLVQQNYYLCEYLSQGGEGIIFEGYKQESQTKYKELAFKIIFDQEQEDVEDEIQILQFFKNNTNIIQFYGFLKISSNICVFIFEKCQISLKSELEFLKQQEKFPKEKLLQMIFNLLDGLIQLRIYNVIHFDIKPQNILLSDSGNYVYIDFGISQIKKQSIKQIKGYTVKYAPPQQKNDDIKTIDFRADVYALGKTFLDIIESYKNAKQIDQQMINSFKTIIKENMLQLDQNTRQNCLELHKLFFQKLEQFDCLGFQMKYFTSMQNILKTYPFDYKKDIIYFHQASLYYNLNILSLYKFLQTKNVFVNSKKLSQQIVNILQHVSESYSNIGDYQNTLQYSIQALQLCRKDLKEKHIEIAHCLNQVGLRLQNIGHYQQALQFIQESLKIYQQHFLYNNFYIENSLNNLSTCYHCLGDNKKALLFILESIQMKRQLYKFTNQSLLTSLNNLNILYAEAGNQQKALKNQQDLIQLWKQIYTDSHPKFSKTLNNMGMFFFNLGDYQNALKYFQNSLRIQRKFFQKSHPQIAISLMNIGLIYRELQETQKALDYLFEALETLRICLGGRRLWNLFQNNQNSIKNIPFTFLCLYDSGLVSPHRQIFKENHPEVAKCLSYIGLCFSDFGEHKKAFEYQYESYQMLRFIFKEKHQLVAVSLSDLGLCCSNIGDDQKCLQFQLESLQMIKLLNSQNDLNTAFILAIISTCYQNAHDYKKALQYSLESLLMYRVVLKKNHNRISESLDLAGYNYLKIDKNQKALEYFSKALQIKKIIWKQDDFRIAKSLDNLAFYNQQITNYQKALELYQQSLQIYRQNFQEINNYIAKALSSVGFCYQKLMDFDNSLYYYYDSLQLFRKLQKTHQPCQLIANCLYNIGEVHLSVKQFQNALQNFQESLQMRKQIFKQNHPDIMNSLANLAFYYLTIKDFQNSLKYYFQALNIQNQISKHSGTKINTANYLNNIGLAYASSKDYKIALEYYFECLQIHREIRNQRSPTKCIAKIGFCYLELKNYGKALNYFLTYLELQKQNVNENDSHTLEILNAIDFCYLNLQDINMALQYRFEILEILNQNQQSNEKQIFNSMLTIGIYYRFLGQNQKAKEYLLKCYYF